MTDSPRDERDPLGLLPEFHRSTRMPLDAVVRLHFEGTVAYQNGFAANVSALGMFVKHPDPPPVGTRLVFEFVLGDERKPVQGGGVVAWVRERYEGPGRPAGVGIQFTELDALSRQHVAESLFEFLETQLGVEIADHPDVPDLLAAMPRTTSIDVAPADAPPQGELSFAPGGPEPSAAPDPAPRADEPPPFRLFDDEWQAGEERELLAGAGPDLFAPVAPPDDLGPSSREPHYGAAQRREMPRWLPVALVAGVTAALLAGWWFLAGPGADRPAPAAAPSTAAAPAARTAPPQLDPRPGSAATLAEAVGAVPAGDATPTPLLEARPPEPAAESSAPGATAEAAGAAGDATAPARFSRLLEITSSSEDGGTDVALVGDGDFPAGSYRWFEIRDERPRVLVRLTGVAARFPRDTLPLVTAELAGVRIGFHQKPTGNELHVVLDLQRRDVRVDGVDAAGDRLVVRLRQP